MNAFERDVAGVLFDSIGEALVSTKSIVLGSKKRLIKKNPLARSSRRHAHGSVGRTVAMPARSSLRTLAGRARRSVNGGVGRAVAVPAKSSLRTLASRGRTVATPARVAMQWVTNRCGLCNCGCSSAKQVSLFAMLTKNGQALPMAVNKQYSKDTKERRGVKGISGSVG